MSVRRLDDEDEIKEVLKDVKSGINIELFDVPVGDGDDEHVSLGIKVTFNTENGEPPEKESDLTFAQQVGLKAVQDINHALDVLGRASDELNRAISGEDTPDSSQVKDEIDTKLEELGMGSINNTTTKH